MSGNRITNLPSSICNLRNIYYFDLSGNFISGQIPSCIGDMVSLYSFDLGGNQFKGPLPESLAKLDRLSGMSIRDNRISGEIPELLFMKMKNLQNLITYINLSGTQLSGPFPEIGNLTNLHVLRLFNTGVTSLPSFEGMNFYEIDCHNAALSGPFPASVLGMRYLSNLNLSFNNMSGPLPDVPSNLNEFHVDHNNFEGELPRSMSNWTSLNVLNLSHNKFNGTLDVLAPIPN
ncbi:hypothetical protein HDU76_008353, partial [Blyttiomyces sp. JEL0837]